MLADELSRMDRDSPSLQPSAAGIAVGSVGGLLCLALLPDTPGLLAGACGAWASGLTVGALSTPPLRRAARDTAITAVILGFLAAGGTVMYTLALFSGPSVVGLLAGVWSALQVGLATFVLVASGSAVAAVARRLSLGMGVRSLTSPVFLGSLAGLAVGVAAVAAGAALVRTPSVLLLGLTGSVAGGVTAAALTDGELDRVVGSAVVADILSTLYVFVGILVGYVVIEGDPELFLVTPFYLLFGWILLLPLGAMSALVAMGAGAATFYVKRRPDALVE